LLERLPEIVTTVLPQLIANLPTIIKDGLAVLPVLMKQLIPDLANVIFGEVIPALIEAMPMFIELLSDLLLKIIDVLVDKMDIIIEKVINAIINLAERLPEIVGNVAGAAIKGTVGLVARGTLAAFTGGLSETKFAKDIFTVSP